MSIVFSAIASVTLPALQKDEKFSITYIQGVYYNFQLELQTNDKK